MGRPDKFKGFINLFKKQLQTVDEETFPFKNIKEWYTIFTENGKINLHLSQKGFGILLHRVHFESTLCSKMIISRCRKRLYRFIDSAVDNDKMKLRSRVISRPRCNKRYKCHSGLDLLSQASQMLLPIAVLTTTTTTTTSVATEELENFIVPAREPFNKQTLDYITLTGSLNFEIDNRPNVLYPDFPNIRIHHTKSLSEGLKWHMLVLYEKHTQGQEHLLTWKEKLTVKNAIIRNVSYHNGYKKPVISSRTFRRYIDKYKD